MCESNAQSLSGGQDSILDFVHHIRPWQWTPSDLNQATARPIRQFVDAGWVYSPLPLDVQNLFSQSVPTRPSQSYQNQRPPHGTVSCHFIKKPCSGNRTPIQPYLVHHTCLRTRTWLASNTWLLSKPLGAFLTFHPKDVSYFRRSGLFIFHHVFNFQSELSVSNFHNKDI